MDNICIVAVLPTWPIVVLAQAQDEWEEKNIYKCHQYVEKLVEIFTKLLTFLKKKKMIDILYKTQSVIIVKEKKYTKISSQHLWILNKHL